MGAEQAQVTMLAVESIKPYENNARTHSDEQINKLRKSLREFGFVNPVLINEDNTLIAGHARLEAATREGFKEIPAIYIKHLTPEQQRAYVIADNRIAELAKWDYEILRDEMTSLADLTLTGFSLSDFENIKSYVSVVDDIQEPDYSMPDFREPAEYTSIMHGDIFMLGDHRVMCGDATSESDVETLMDGAVADLILTDPPYNVDYEGKVGKIENDNMSNESFYYFMRDSTENALRHLKPGGGYYIFHASSQSHTVAKALIDLHIEPKQQLVWAKNRATYGRQDCKWKHELIYYGWKEGTAHYFAESEMQQSTVLERVQQDLSSKSKGELIDLIEFIRSEMEKEPTTIILADAVQDCDLHPTMKPIKLLAQLIHNSTRIDELVIDLFGGSGSTLIAANAVERKCYMMELDPKYVETICRRWEQLTGGKRTKV